MYVPSGTFYLNLFAFIFFAVWHVSEVLRRFFWSLPLLGLLWIVSSVCLMVIEEKLNLGHFWCWSSDQWALKKFRLCLTDSTLCFFAPKFIFIFFLISSSVSL